MRSSFGRALFQVCFGVLAAAAVLALIVEYFWVILAVIVVVSLIKRLKAQRAEAKVVGSKLPTYQAIAQQSEVDAHHARVRALELENGMVLPTPEEVVAMTDRAAKAKFDARMVRLAQLQAEGIMSPNQIIVRRYDARQEYMAEVDRQS